MRKKLLLSAVAFVVALLVVMSNVAAQTQFGTVTGQVTDTTGAIVPEAKVTLSNRATNTRQETRTNAEGLYALANVSAGDYEIAIEKEGFRKSVQRFSVGVAETVTLNFTMQLGSVTETVTVTEAAITINMVSGEISREVTGKELEALPNLTRNPYALVAMAPGAVDTATTNGDVRGLGLFLGIDLVTDRETRAPATRQASYVVNRLREEGILAGTDGPHHNVIKLRPPLCFAAADAGRFASMLDSVLREPGAQPVA